MANSLLIAAALLGAFAGHKILSCINSLSRARRFAARSPIPSVTTLAPQGSMIFWIISLYIAPLIENMPFKPGYWFLWVKKDFSWHTRGRLAREELGSDTYWTLHYDGLTLHTSDAAVMKQIVDNRRAKDFPKKAEDYHAMGVFGPNIISTEGPEWQRHRKITAPPFSERNFGLVFENTVRQAQAMLFSFTHLADGHEATPGEEPVVKDLIYWTMTLTLNVLAAASFNLDPEWRAKSIAIEEQRGSRKPDILPSDSEGLPFQKSFTLVMNNLRALIVFPPWLLRISPLRYLQEAADDFRTHVREMIENYRTAKTDEDQSSAGALLASIVKASTAAEGRGFSEEEMIGNIYMFTLAGYETTASTALTCFIRLAMDPELQGLVQKEIDGIWAAKKAGEVLTYDDYKSMRVIMAVMLESLRIYPPAVTLYKITKTGQTLSCNGRDVYIPPNSRVNIDVVATHRNPTYWGGDAQDFRPSRWLMQPGYTAPPGTENESATHADLLCPPKGAFVAFNSGKRVCLRKKFAQVEFCTLMATVLKKHSVELVGMGREESWERARKRALRAVEDRETGMAMKMRRNVEVRFVRRGAETFSVRLS